MTERNAALRDTLLELADGGREYTLRELTDAAYAACPRARKGGLWGKDVLTVRCLIQQLDHGGKLDVARRRARAEDGYAVTLLRLSRRTT